MKRLGVKVCYVHARTNVMIERSLTIKGPLSRQNWTPIEIGPMGPFLMSELDRGVHFRWIVLNRTVKVGPAKVGPTKLDPPVTTKRQEYMEYVSVP